MKPFLYLFTGLLLSAGVPVAVSQETLPAVAPRMTRADQEAFLKQAKIVQHKALSRGVTNSERATLSDGNLRHDAHIQTIDISQSEFRTDRGVELNFRDSYKYNIAAYLLDKIMDLNMVPVSVERKAAGKTAAMTWWVDDTMMTELDRHNKKMEPPDQEAWNKQMHVVRVFDQLIFNTDRNLGNLVIDKNWRIWMIDHTRAFRLRTDLQNPKNLVRCERKLLSAMRKLDEDTLIKGLRPYLTKTEVKAVLARRDKIVEFFDREVAAKGEAAVLYDLPR
jgi:hypothetical protein